ncbi:alpha-hydroxy acid oxidase [Paracidovorax konjaci]|uniref:FMN-dependent dehydrogenase, includes L-lactate dehydrogenase and type II isopentenyl diphosphate isomerase n=1 Tax=Paracidovorax konjaci TaxID=32040 RepID=A0A1I1VH97_9BURK|nr:alpha-hydroxy acid oxidase [Paracidovorax konjaci]SFD82316.1 FMN-dependent dehydrogenase, includes L-lactate dehydrogenase and type II isopentenyl diphosphate isomerase [Paracidovorax konjaci]
MSPAPSPSAPERIPPGVHNAIDYALLAPRHLDAARLAYVAGGSGHDLTVAANARAFAAWAVPQRLLRDVRHGHLRATVGGEAWEHPIALAPVAFQRLAHPLGELGTARAAGATGTCLIASTLSSQPLEAIAQSCGPAPRWFQLYFQPRRDDTLGLLRRAEAAGYRAIVVTLDAAIQTASRRALEAGFCMPADCTAANLAGCAPTELPPPAPGQGRVFHAMHAAPTWDDLDWLLAQSRLPVWVKGVQHPDDARALQARGAAGIVVSNHGGRGLDGAPATLQMLPAVRAAVGAAFPVLFDGGIRSGTDVFKALALGADAVLVGRLQVYALAVAGALGVAHMLQLLAEELQACMALAGCATVADIGPGALVAQPPPFFLFPSDDTPC